MLALLGGRDRVLEMTWSEAGRVVVNRRSQRRREGDKDLLIRERAVDRTANNFASRRPRCNVSLSGSNVRSKFERTSQTVDLAYCSEGGMSAFGVSTDPNAHPDPAVNAAQKARRAMDPDRRRGRSRAGSRWLRLLAAGARAGLLHRTEPVRPREAADEELRARDLRPRPPDRSRARLRKRDAAAERAPLWQRGCDLTRNGHTAREFGAGERRDGAHQRADPRARRLLSTNAELEKIILPLLEAWRGLRTKPRRWTRSCWRPLA